MVKKATKDSADDGGTPRRYVTNIVETMDESGRIIRRTEKLDLDKWVGTGGEDNLGPDPADPVDQAKK